MRASGHITAEAVESYRRRLLPPAELLAAQAHAARCEECRARLAGAVGLDAAFKRVHDELDGPRVRGEEPEHLPYERLAAFVDGALDEVTREIAESHLAVCAECAGDVDDLRRYQPIVADVPARPAPSAVGSPAKAPGAWRRRLSSLDFILRPRSLMPAAAAAAVVFAALLGLWAASRRSAAPDSDGSARINTAGSTDTAQSQRVSSGMNAAGNPTPAPTPESPASSNVRQGELAAASRPSRPPRQDKKMASGTAAPEALASRVMLNDGGGQVAFDARGGLRGLEALTPDARTAVRRSLETRRVETPRVLDGLARGAAGVLMSGEATSGEQAGVPFALVGPVGKVVREDRPVLRWRPLAGAVSYKAAIVNSKFQLVAEGSPSNATEWAPPVALPRGQIYYWQVTATLADGSETTSPRSPAPQAKFRVLERTAEDELRRLEESAPESHLARGVFYAHAGLVEEAAAEFRKLADLNPRSPVARQLLRSVRSR
jgi:anti-sigma factor RsiW